jgi:hypothetical protein
MASEIWLNPADIHNTAPSYWVILPNSSHLAGRLPAASFAGSMTGMPIPAVEIISSRDRVGSIAEAHTKFLSVRFLSNIEI